MVMGTLDVSATDAAKTSASGAHDDDDDVDDDESLLYRGEGAHAMAGIRLDLGNRRNIPPALILGSSTLQVFWIKKGKMKEMTVSNISPGVGVMCEGGGIE